MGGKTMPQRVGMDSFLDARFLDGFMTGMPNRFRIDRLIAAMVVMARKEPDPGSWP